MSKAKIRKNKKRDYYAPYLTIQGKRVRRGRRYWYVDIYTGVIVETKADCENNIRPYICFLNKEAALNYATLKVTSIGILKTLGEIERISNGQQPIYFHP